jgi:CheY-like chemotaxis protein
MATVLCTGAERVLIETRTLILRQAGHTVVPATGESELIAACAENKFDVAVIGQAISDVEKLRVFSLVRRHCPAAKVLELYAPYKRKVLTEADGWLEVPAQVPTDLAVHVERLALDRNRGTQTAEN